MAGPYDIYPSVDAGYNFPSEIRTALIASTDVQAALTATKNATKTELQTAKFDPIDAKFASADLRNLNNILYGTHSPTVNGPSDLLVTPVSGDRSVTVASGVAYFGGVRYKQDASQTLTIPTPGSTGGRWVAITLDRQWGATQAATLRQDDLNLSDTSTVTPTYLTTAVITALTALVNQPNTEGASAGQRQLLAVLYVKTSSTTMATFDLRAWNNGAGTLTAATLAGAAAICARHLKEGATIGVATHTLPVGRHFKSLWQRNVNGNLNPVAEITIEDQGADWYACAETLRLLVGNLNPWLVFNHEGTRVFDLTKRISYQYNPDTGSMEVTPGPRTRMVARADYSQPGMPSNVWTAMNFDRMVYDPCGMWKYGNDIRRFKLPWVGRYRITCHYALNGGDTNFQRYQFVLYSTDGQTQNSDPPMVDQSTRPSDAPITVVTEVYNDVPNRSAYARVFQNTGSNRGFTYGNYPLNAEIQIEFMGVTTG